MRHTPPLFRCTLAVLLGLAACAGPSVQQSLATATSELLGQLPPRVSTASGEAPLTVAVDELPFLDPPGPAAADEAAFVEALLVAELRRQGYPRVRVVTRRDLPAIYAEMRAQMDPAFREDQAVEMGQLLGAEAIVVGRLDVRDGDTLLLLQVLDVETREVLAATETRLELGATPATELDSARGVPHQQVRADPSGIFVDRGRGALLTIPPIHQACRIQASHVAVSPDGRRVAWFEVLHIRGLLPTAHLALANTDGTRVRASDITTLAPLGTSHLSGTLSWQDDETLELAGMIDLIYQGVSWPTGASTFTAKVSPENVVYGLDWEGPARVILQ